MSSFDEVGSYCLSLVGNEIHLHYYIRIETVRHSLGTATITIKGQVLPRYAGPVKQLVEQKILAYLRKGVKVTKVTREEFESLDIQLPGQYKVRVRRRKKV